MRFPAFETGAALLVDQPRRGVGKTACRIAKRFAAFGLDMECPARAEAFQNIIGARRDRDKLGLGGGFEIGSAEREHPAEAAVLVQDNARRDERRPWQMVGEPVRSEEHTSELQSLMRNSYAVFCLKKKKTNT